MHNTLKDVHKSVRNVHKSVPKDGNPYEFVGGDLYKIYIIYTHKAIH